MTLLNAVVATAKLAQDLYPPGDPRVPVAPATLSLSIGATNGLSCWFGHFPSCHGCGGLAGQHSFGARTGSSMVLMGTAKMLTACLFGPSLLAGLAAFPNSVLGVLLAVREIKSERAERRAERGRKERQKERIKERMKRKNEERALRGGHV